MKIIKHLHHHHFWVSNGILYESYNTLRGMRYSMITEVPMMEDNDDVSEELINKIIKLDEKESPRGRS